MAKDLSKYRETRPSYLRPWDKIMGEGGYGLIREVTPQTASAKRDDSDLVYQTNAWNRYQWRDFLTGSDDTVKIAHQGSEKIERWPAYMREIFTRMYTEAPQQVEDVHPVNQWANQAHQLAEELPEWERLKDRCQGDRLWSGVSASALSEEVLKVLPVPDERIENPSLLERRIEGLEQLAEAGVPTSEQQQQAKQAMQEMRDAASKISNTMDASAMRQAIRRGIQRANKDIDQAQSTLDAFGWGEEAGSAGRGGDVEAKRKLMERVSKSKKLKRLAELAGRMRRIAAQKQRTKAEYRRDEVSDICLGDDLARLLPIEALKLTDKDLEFVFYKNLLERNLLNYHLRGQESQGRGPIIVCIDNSSSMSGEREIWSKAIALAMLDIARKQKRSFAALHFSTRVECRLIWEHGPNAPGWEKICEAMDFFSGGGTKFKPVMMDALCIIEDDKFNKADIILITDGAASTSAAAEYKRRAKAREATTYGIEIKSYGASHNVMQSWCDSVTVIDDLSGPNAASDLVFNL